MDRTGRISEEIRKELSDLIHNGIKDPRMPPFVSVTAVKVTKDLRFAKTYVSVLGTDEQKKGALQALKSAAGYIRHEIGQRVLLRYTPEFHFELDDSIEKGIHINQLINQTLHGGLPAAPANPTPEADTEEEDDEP